MRPLTDRRRDTAYGLKLVAVGFGSFTVIFSLAYIFDELASIIPGARANLSDVVLLLSAFVVCLSGAALIAAFPESLRAKFRRTPVKPVHRPVYGFTTVLAVGLGATLGSPLFILIPINIIQYEFVSLGSLLVASILSILMARVYANMYTESINKGYEAVGGPSFTRVAVGTKSVRYFVSRLSMWIANTALAAYTKIVFLVFDIEFMPAILANYGITGTAAQLIVWLTAALFVGWSIVNALFERRYLRTIGHLQIFFTAVMVAILVYQSLLLGSVGSWRLGGILQLGPSGNWIFALIVNTGYLYLLFFGFQEIQALERDTLDSSSIPFVSWVRPGYKLRKSTYLGIAMIASVVIAAAINIFFGLAVYAVHPSLAELQNSQIPALYLAGRFLGPGQELLMAVAFLIATITTFVPAFIAAARHLAALGEDEYMPQTLSKLSWVFTLVAIFILAVGDQNFLVAITDYLVLISLAIICLSAIWLRKSGILHLKKEDALPFVVGMTCFVAGAAIYFVSASVVVFGSLAVAFTYLVFDILELGSLGSQLFHSILNVTSFAFLAIFPRSQPPNGYFLSLLRINPLIAGDLLLVLLWSSFVLLLTNLFVDIKLLGRSGIQRSD
jgi:amino acid transporter